MTSTNPRSSDQNSSPDPDQTFVGPMNGESAADQSAADDSAMSAADQTFVPDQQGSTPEPNAGQVTDATFVPAQNSVDDQLGSTFVPPANAPQAAVDSTIIPATPASDENQNELEADSTFVMPRSALPSGSPDDSDDPEVTRVRPRNPDGSPPKASVEELNADATAIYSQSIGNRPPDDDPHEQETLERGTQAPKTRANIEGRTIGPKGPGRSSQIWNVAGKGGLDSVISLRKRPVSGSGAGPFTTAEDADFEVVQKLAEGGMGVVYVARQKSLNRELAIKTLKVQGRSGQATRAQGGPTQLSRAERQKREMFLSEALVTANLVHPNIIPIHELAETNDGVPYYVMKRVHGIPWNKRIREMSLAQNLEVLHKVCDAMAYAHHHGVINRDLKPENIMLGEFGEVLVLDWGLAVPAPHAVDRNFRSPAASFGAGTPAYMAPELWTGPETAIGEASDIYLLGAILFEIITHLPPHEFPAMPARGTNMDMMKVIDGVLRDNKIRATSESGELMDIAMKAMKTDPDKRFGSVLEFQFAVRNFQRHEESRRLSNRAGELLESKDGSREYHTYQTAAALFEESLRTWKNNGPARNGLRTTRLRYAKLASSKGDFDLGLQIASQEDDSEFLSLQRRLVTARRLRASVKWAAVAAMVCVILLGVKAIYDNGIITNLNAEVETRQKEAAALIAKAEEARDAVTAAEEAASTATLAAQTAKEQAQLAVTEAESAKKTADAAKLEAAASAMLAATEKQNAEKAQEMAAQATTQAMTAQKEATSAKAAAEAANMQVATAKTQLADAELKTREAQSQQEKAETAARVAQVEIQSQLIRGHTLSQNYADALREVDQLLNGDLLPQLPETIQTQRRSELEAQREQLLRRTRQSEAPIQSQVISPDGSLLVTGDRNGLVEIFNNPARTLEWGAKPIGQHQFASEIYRMRFGQNRLFIAVGQDVFVWDLKSDAPQTVVSHETPIRGLDVDARYLISGDTSGVILIHDAQTLKPVTRLAALTQLQDVAIVPGTSDFLYAGSRGGQSADILAYRIPGDEPDTTDKAAALKTASDFRPRRLGQLRMTRGQNEPPAALSVSPDGAFLAISNQTNGDLLILPRTQKDGSDSFPFRHPAELEQAGKTQWKLSKHARPINDLRWSSDSQHLLTASDDRSIGVWDRSSDAASLKFRNAVRGHGARVLQCLFLNPESTRIASSSADLQSRLWDLSTLDADTKQLRQVFHLSMLGPAEPRATQRRTHLGYLPVALPLTSEDEASEAAQSKVRGDDAAATQTPEPISKGESRSLETISTAGPVRAVRFDTRGDRLLGGTSDGTLMLWNTVTGDRLVAASGQETLREGHEFHIAQMAVAGADRSILITAGYDGTLRLWDLGTSGRTGIQKQVLSGIGLVNAFAASSDGQWLATTSASANDGAEAGATGASVSGQFGCQVWNIEELLKQPRPQARMSLNGVHKSELTSLSFSPSGQYLATGGRDGVLAIWDLAQGSLLTQTRAHRRNTIVSSLHWLNDQHILSAGMDGQLLTWSLRMLAEKKSESELTRDVTFERDQTPIERVSVSPDRTQMLVISVDTDRKSRRTKSAVELRSTSDSSVRKQLTLAIVGGQTPTQISSGQWSSNGQQILLATNTGIQEFRAPEWKVKRVFSAGTGVSDSQFVSRAAPAGPATPQEQDSCILTFDGNTARLWSNESRDQIASFRGPFPIRDVALTSGDSPLAVSAGLTLRVFDGRVSEGQGGKPLFRIPEEQGVEVTRIAPDEQTSPRLAFADSSGVVRLGDWDQTTNTLMIRWSLKAVESPVAALRWTPKNDLLAVVSVLGEIVLVNTDGIATVRTRLPDSPSCRVTSADIDSTGQFLALAGERVSTSESIGWILSDLMSQQGQQKTDPDAPVAERLANVVCQFSGHSAGGITAVHFVPSSPYLISGGHDGAIIIWNWQNPLPGSVPVAYEAYRFLSETQPAAHAAPITSLDVSNTQLASAGEDGKVILWKLPESISAVRAAAAGR